MYQFTDIISSEEELTKIIGEVPPLLMAKTLRSLDKHCRNYIAKSPFVLVATCDDKGNFDLSPKGDPCGFVKVIDDHTLVIPDRLGNRRVDSFKNLLKSPQVGLIFLIPGKNETLRISGSAKIIKDQDILASMEVQNKIPHLGLAVHVEEAFFHCSKCMVRSKLWNPDKWPSLEGLPSLAQTMLDASKQDIPLELMENGIEQDAKERLY